jgi:phosphoribosylanthranilate isomerase
MGAARVKICGLRTHDTLSAALEAGADEVGLVFFPASPRNISLDDAARLSAASAGRAEIVALTVDADDALIEQIMTRVRPQVLQLHGHESVRRARELSERHGVKIWKAVPVSSAADVDAARMFVPAADQILFDAKPPRDARHPGGNGLTFDWALLSHAHDIPFVLSGGLIPENVAAAIAATGAQAVDVSSGVERAPGVKDAALISAFVRAAKSAA